MGIPSIRYDFSEFLNITNNIISGKRDSSTLRDLKNELNRFFKDSKCNNILITENTDKFFFGARVMPIINNYEIADLLFSDKKIRIVEYEIELDDKLFNPLLNITDRELVAIILHEIGHVVNTAEPIENIRKVLDEYAAKNKEVIKIYDSVHYKELLVFGVKEFISKRKSLFYSHDTEILADEFTYRYGFDKDLVSFQDKIISHGSRIHADDANPFMTMAWVLSVYKNIGMRRIGAIKKMQEIKMFTASKLEKREVENIIKRLNRIDDSAITEASIKDIYKAKIGKMKYNSMKQLEDDYYELSMRCKTVEEEEDALYLMRQLNIRISIIDDYVSTEKLEESERMRWSKTLQRFMELRDKLSNTSIYKVRNYGILVNYPEIIPNNY